MVKKTNMGNLGKTNKSIDQNNGKGEPLNPRIVSKIFIMEHHPSIIYYPTSPSLI